MGELDVCGRWGGNSMHLYVRVIFCNLANKGGSENGSPPGSLSLSHPTHPNLRSSVRKKPRTAGGAEWLPLGFKNVLGVRLSSIAFSCCNDTIRSQGTCASFSIVRYLVYSQRYCRRQLVYSNPGSCNRCRSQAYRCDNNAPLASTLKRGPKSWL